MSLLREVTELGERLGYEGSDLATFVNTQLNIERDERAAARAAEKEKIEAEKEKIEAETRKLKRGTRDMSDNQLKDRAASETD